MKAAEICAAAAGLVVNDRADTHGDMHRNMSNIAILWNGFMQIKIRRNGACSLDGADVAAMLELLKIARRYSGRINRDDYIDAAGYAGIAGQLATKGD